MAEETKSIARKTSLSPTCSWIKLDANGHGSLLDVDKYDIMYQVHIDARDLRILDPLLSYPSTILCRERAIILNLEVVPLKFFHVIHFFFPRSVFFLLCVLAFAIFCFQHIKAIITAEEVSQILFYSLYKPIGKKI